MGGEHSRSQLANTHQVVRQEMSWSVEQDDGVEVHDYPLVQEQQQPQRCHQIHRSGAAGDMKNTRKINRKFINYSSSVRRPVEFFGVDVRRAKQVEFGIWLSFSSLSPRSLPSLCTIMGGLPFRQSHTPYRKYRFHNTRPKRRGETTGHVLGFGWPEQGADP